GVRSPSAPPPSPKSETSLPLQPRWPPCGVVGEVVEGLNASRQLSGPFDDADPVANLDLRSVLRRQALDAPEDAICGLALRRHRPAALRARPLMTEIDRVDADFGQAIADEIADCESLLPLLRVAGVALGAALVARLDEFCRRRAIAEIVALIGF